jgi:hypothetical protein
MTAEAVAWRGHPTKSHGQPEAPGMAETTSDHFALRTLLLFLEKECGLTASELSKSAGLTYPDYKNYRNFRSGSSDAAAKKFPVILTSIEKVCAAHSDKIGGSPVARFAYRRLFPLHAAAEEEEGIFDEPVGALSDGRLLPLFLNRYAGLWWAIRPGSGLDGDRVPKFFNLALMTVSPSILPGQDAARIKYYYRHGRATVGMPNAYESFLCAAAVQHQWIDVLGMREYGTDTIQIRWPFLKKLERSEGLSSFYGIALMNNSDLRPIASRLWFASAGKVGSEEDLERLKKEKRGAVGSYKEAELRRADFLDEHRKALGEILPRLGTVVDIHRLYRDD